MDRAPRDWYADESLWAETYSLMFPDRSFKAAIDQVDRIIELTGIEQGKLLDVGSGPGRHAVPFAKHGFAVTGIDITPFLIEKARTYADAEGVEIELIQADMRSFVRADAYDIAINMLTSFGYFDDEAENLKVLRNIHASLRPGGVFVFDTIGKERLAKIFLDTSLEELPDGSLVVQRRQAINDWSQMENEWLLIRDGRVRSFGLRHWIYSGREFKQMMRSAGLSDVKLYGDLEGSPYGPEATRMIAVGRKASDS